MPSDSVGWKLRGVSRTHFPPKRKLGAEDVFLAFNFLLLYKYLQWYINDMDKAEILIEAPDANVQRNVIRFSDFSLR